MGNAVRMLGGGRNAFRSSFGAAVRRVERRAVVAAAAAAAAAKTRGGSARAAESMATNRPVT